MYNRLFIEIIRKFPFNWGTMFLQILFEAKIHTITARAKAQEHLWLTTQQLVTFVTLPFQRINPTKYWTKLF